MLNNELISAMLYIEHEIYCNKGMFSWQKVTKKSLRSTRHIEYLDACMEH
jgi:hypothetical protein